MPLSEFVAKLSTYPASAVASPHLFQKVAVPGICVAYGKRLRTLWVNHGDVRDFWRAQEYAAAAETFRGAVVSSAR